MRAWLCCLLLCACASGPPPIAADAEPVLAEAEAMLAAGNHVACRNLLVDRDERTFPKPLRDRYAWTLARAQFALGEHWEAFQTIREFADKNPHSDLRPQIVELELDIGRTLIRSDHGFLFFWSDKRAGRTVLEHLITRYPDNAWLADELRLLGELAFADGNFTLAQERFHAIVVERPESEWVPLARFRYAMCIVGDLRGPEYDLDRMEQASRELRDYLARQPENADFVAQAQAALARVQSWRATRHLVIARFYEIVDNAAGQRRHLRLAAADEFADTPAGLEARARLAALPAGGGP